MGSTNLASTLRATEELVSDHQKTFRIARPLLRDLSSWHQGFLQQLNNANDAKETVSIINTLGYHYIEIIIFRAILRPFFAENQQSAGALSSEEPEAVRYARSGTQHCVEAALEFIRRLKLDHVLLFWPVWTQTAFSSIGILTLLMFLTSTSSEEAMEWMKTLQKIRAELRIKSSQLPILRLGLFRIDSVFWKGFGQVFILEQHIHEALNSA